MERTPLPTASVTALEARRGLSRRERVSWVVGLVLVAVGIGAADHWGTTSLPKVSATLAAYGLAICIVTAATSYLLYSYATSSRNRSFLALGSTYLLLAILALVVPLTTRSVVLADERVLGAATSGRVADFLWRLMLPVGVLISTALMWRDAQHFRRAGRGTHVGAAVVSTLAVAAALVALVVLWPPSLPSFLAPDGSSTTAAEVGDWLVLILSAAGFALVAGLAVRWGSLITRWLCAVMALSLGNAVLNIGHPLPFTLAWYTSRLFFLGALLALMILLIHHLGSLQRRATHHALTDDLTGLMSRAGLIELLDHEIRRARHLGARGALLWVDLDSFKAINDQLGHGAGDEVLALMAARLHKAARRGDAVARLGGDEFGVLLCDLPPGLDAHHLADRILDAVREPLSLDDGDSYVTASIGVAEFPSDGTTAEGLLRLADQAMYAAKHDGGDGIERYSSSLAAQFADRAAMRRRLAGAVHDRDFELHYQPVVDLVTGRAIGAEALVRWRRDGALVAGADFIPFAESSGQIRAIGQVVLHLMVADLERLGPDLPRGFRVSVNLSAPELADPEVIDFFCTGPLSPVLEHLAVEVTEGITIAEYPRVEQHVGRLREAGAVIAIDDFGAGFANIDALQSLRPQVIKVDRVFARRAAQGDAAGHAFLRAALTIGDAFGARVVAEGIETETHRRKVIETGIRFGQGYLLGAPAAELPLWPGLTPTGPG